MIRRLKTKMKKKILLIVIAVLVIDGLVGIGVTNHIKEREAEHALEVKAQKKLALYIIQQFEFKTKVKKMNFTAFDKPTIFGGGGYTTYLRINDDSNPNHLLKIGVTDLKSPVTEDEPFFVFYGNNVISREKLNKNLTLEGIKIGEWKK